MTRDATPAHGSSAPHVWSLAGVIPLLALCQSVQAAEITSFKLTDLESSLELKYELSDRETTEAGVTKSRQTQNNFSEKLRVDTRSYIYHPNLLKLDAGLGLSMFQRNTDSGGTSYSVDSQFVNFNLRASVLEKKPYPMVLFARRDSTSTNPSLGESLIQTTTGYGFGLTLRSPLIPLTVNMDISHEQQSGESESRIVDSTQDLFSLQALKQYGRVNFIQGAYRWSRRDSASGALDPATGGASGSVNPISATEDTTQVLSLGTSNVFGNNDQFTLSSSTNYSLQKGVSPGDSFSFLPDLRWKYSDDLTGDVQYSLNRSTREDTSSEGQAIKSGVKYRINRQFSTAGRLKWDESQATGIQLTSRGGEAQVFYQREWGALRLDMDASVNVEQREQTSSSATATIIGESIVLIGLTPVPLSHPFVDVGSVVVSNSSRSQTYTDGIDYRLVTVGSVTTIERLSAGSIQDGEQILVDYDYQTGGTYASTAQGTSAAIHAHLYDYYSAYLSYAQTSLSLDSGTPTIPLNPATTVRYGAAVTNYPLPWRVRGSMSLDITHQDEVVSPSDAVQFQADVNMPIGRRTQLLASFQKATVDNRNSAEDSDLVAYYLAVRSRPFGNLGLTAEISKQTDTGGSLLRDNMKGSLKADWRRFRLQMAAVADYVVEKQGDVQQNDFKFSLLLRRDF